MKQSLADRIAERPLSGKQKSLLVIMYRRAFARAEAHHATEGASFEEWRRAECVSATQHAAGGPVTISTAKQRHFNDLKAQAESLLGDSGAAFRTAMKSKEAERITPLRRLIADCVQAFSPYGMGMPYMASIVRDKFGGALFDELDENQLEQLLMTLRARGSALKQRQAKEQGA